MKFFVAQLYIFIVKFVFFFVNLYYKVYLTNDVSKINVYRLIGTALTALVIMFYYYILEIPLHVYIQNKLALEC